MEVIKITNKRNNKYKLVDISQYNKEDIFKLLNAYNINLFKLEFIRRV